MLDNADTAADQKQRIWAAVELIDAALETEESLGRKGGFMWKSLSGANDRLYETLRLIDGFGTGPLCEEDPDVEGRCAYHRVQHNDGGIDAQ